MNTDQLIGRLSSAQGHLLEIIGVLCGVAKICRRGALKRREGGMRFAHGDLKASILRMH